MADMRNPYIKRLEWPDLAEQKPIRHRHEPIDAPTAGFPDGFADTGCLGMFFVDSDPERIDRVAWEIAKEEMSRDTEFVAALKLAVGLERFQKLAAAACVAYKKPAKRQPRPQAVDDLA